jgi:hypothetical protein
MDLREQFKTAMAELSDTEEMIVLSVMIDTLIEKVNDLKNEVKETALKIFVKRICYN